MMFRESEYVSFEKFMQKINQYAKVSIENKKIADKWYAIAQNDIEISEILLEKEYYAGGIYHIEQAFEKITKGFYIDSGRMSPEEARGHEFIINRLKKEVTKIDDINELFELVNSLNNKEFSTNGFEEKLEIIKKNEDELRNMKDHEILGLIEFIEGLEKKLKTEDSIKKIDKKIRKRKSMNFLKQVLNRLTKFRIRNSQIKEAIDKKNINQYIDNMFLGMKLHLISLITFPHWNTPRYPDCKPHTDMNFFDYDGNMGIVKSSDKVIEIFKNIMKTTQVDEKGRNR